MDWEGGNPKWGTLDSKPMIEGNIGHLDTENWETTK